jgi:hypothetical protein
VGNIPVIAEGELVKLLKLEQYVFCVTTTYLRSLAFKVGELRVNQFSYAPNPDRYRWNEMLLWDHAATLTTKSETATC